MKELYKGYTLAEVLVTIGIIGIIAALVAPGLAQNMHKNTISASLARSAELIQTGMTNILNTAQNNDESGNAFSGLTSIQIKDILGNGANNANSYITEGDYLFSRTNSFLGVEEDEDYVINNIKDYNGNNIANNMLSNTIAFKFTKIKPVIIFQEIPAAKNVDSDENEILTRIYIDANASERPNRVGDDVFLFGLTNRGILIPAGTADFNEFDNRVPVGGCNNTPNNGLACAARVVSDNWNIKY